MSTTLTEKQIENRKRGIGGSDIASILQIEGVFRTQYEIYLDKLGEGIPFQDNDRMMCGRYLEDGIAGIYSEKTGYNTLKPLDEQGEPKTFSHKQYDYLLANIDRIVVDGDGKWIKGLEVKNVGNDVRYKWMGEDRGLRVPDIYQAQVAHYMCVLDMDEWDVIALFGGNDPVIWTITRDRDLEALIIEDSTRFWKENVQKKNPPAIEFSAKAPEFFKRRYPMQEEKEKVISDSGKDWANMHLDIGKPLKDLEHKKSYSQFKILEEMGDASVLFLDNDRKRGFRKRHYAKSVGIKYFEMRGEE